MTRSHQHRLWYAGCHASRWSQPLLANAHDFTAARPKAMTAWQAKRDLSERRRTAARCARDSQNPPILILDEATSALDTVTERLVQDAIKLMANRTTFVIALVEQHPQRRSDFSVDKGRIIERGHMSSLHASGAYRKPACRCWREACTGVPPETHGRMPVPHLRSADGDGREENEMGSTRGI